ncbi:S49 family peptidase [Bradyrhizobium sp. USDA 4506]
MSKLDSIRSALCGLDGELLALDQRRAPTITTLIADLVRGSDVSDARLSAAFGQHAGVASRSISVVPAAGRGGMGLAIISVSGLATYDSEFQPYVFSMRALAQTIHEFAADRTIGSMILVFDTPGGQVTGTPEAADAIYKSRSMKPIAGIVDPLAASAGFWLATQCSELIGVPSSEVGSIGVYVLHVESSRLLDNVGVTPTFISAGENKTEANPFEPLSDKARSYLQQRVDKTYGEFLSAVARGRNASVEIVKSQWGGGRVLAARDALRLRMIDRIEANPDQAWTSVVRQSASRAAKADARRRKLKLAELQ